MTSTLRGLMSTRSLRGRVVVVTGASAGIGRATALRLADRGAVVVAVARDVEALAELSARAANITASPADLAVDSERSDLVARTLSSHGRIDALVDNAGIGWTGLVEDMTVDQLRSLVELNVIGAVDLARLVLPQMLGRGDGDLVFTASVASWFATPPLTAYSATKYAVAGFAEGLRREVMARGVRVHSVHPGPVASEFAARSAGSQPGEVGPRSRSGPGVAPGRVAAAIERALTRPGCHVVAVPRLLGAIRLLTLTPLRQAADLLIAVNGTRLGRLGEEVAADAAGPHIR